MIGHYTINIPEIFQVFEWLSEFARDALRGGWGGGGEGFLKRMDFP